MAGEIAITVIATGFPSDLDSYSEASDMTVGDAMRAAAATLEDTIVAPVKGRAPSGAAAPPAAPVKPARVAVKTRPPKDDEFEEDSEEEQEQEVEERPVRREPERGRGREREIEPARRKSDDDVPDFLSRLRRKR
jgi:hypothetical protein